MKIRITYVFLFHLFIISSCSHPHEKKCEELKNGKFYYKGSDSVFVGAIIHRNDSFQTVIDEKTGDKQEQKVVWTDACTYQLYPFADNNWDSLHPDLYPIKVAILDVTEKYYTVNISSEYRKTDFKDTVWILALIDGLKSANDIFKKK